MSNPQFVVEKGKPLVLPNGARISNDGEVQHADEVAEQDRITEMEIAFAEGRPVQRTLADIPLPSRQMTPIMAVISFSLWGLDANAIAMFLRLPVEDIEAMQRSDVYTRTREELIHSIRFMDADSVHGYLTSNAKVAAKVMVSELASKKAADRMTAAKDVLDRSGFRPADRVEHHHTFEDELRIVHLTDTTPVELELGDIEYGNGD